MYRFRSKGQDKRTGETCRLDVMPGPLSIQSNVYGSPVRSLMLGLGGTFFSVSSPRCIDGLPFALA